MTDPPVRGADRERACAGARGRDAGSAVRGMSFAALLASMPDVGEDADFERVPCAEKAPDVFD